MNKKYWLGIIVIALVTHTAFGKAKDKPHPRGKDFEDKPRLLYKEMFFIEPGVWSSIGKAEWSTSYDSTLHVYDFSDYTITSYKGEGETEVKFENLENYMFFLRGGFFPIPWLGIEGLYGKGDIMNGDITDKRSFEGVTGSEFSGDTDGNNEMYTIDGVFRITELDAWELDRSIVQFDIVAGYRYYKDSLDMKIKEASVVDFKEYSTPRPATGSDEYEYDYKGAQAGIRCAYAFAQEQLEISADFSYLFALSYSGKSRYREHDASGGAGLKADLSFAYYPIKHFGVKLGYQLMQLKTAGGEQTQFHTDGTIDSSSNLDKTETSRYGIYLSAIGRF